MAIVSAYLLIITLNINRLNSSLRRQWLDRLKQKQKARPRQGNYG
jgi:hypothetical protein